jgi:hypothetical protein
LHDAVTVAFLVGKGEQNVEDGRGQWFSHTKPHIRYRYIYSRYIAAWFGKSQSTLLIVSVLQRRLT